jgi:hypothetical protein
MALSVLLAANVEDAGGDATMVVTLTTTAGSLLVQYAGEGQDASHTWTVSDTAVQSWSQEAAGYFTFDSTQRVKADFFANSVSVTSVTTTFDSTVSATCQAVVFEIGGARLTTPEDGTGVTATAGGATSLTSAALTTTNADDILLYGCRFGATVSGVTAGSGYTIPANGSNTRIGMQYKIVSAIQSAVTTSMSWTGASSCCGLFMAFKQGVADARANIQSLFIPLVAA